MITGICNKQRYGKLIFIAYIIKTNLGNILTSTVEEKKKIHQKDFKTLSQKYKKVQDLEGMSRQHYSTTSHSTTCQCLEMNNLTFKY